MTSQAIDVAGLAMGEVVDQMPAAVVIVQAPSARILYANPRARDLTERQLGRSIPSHVTTDWEIFHLDGRPYQQEEWPLLRSITSGEEVVGEEYFNVLPDGSRLIVRSHSSPVYDEERRIVGGVLVMEDFTERKEVEERLAYHASLLDVMDDAVVGTDPDFRVTVWNRGAERLYGYAADEVLGRHARDVASYEGDNSRRELEVDLLDRSRTRTEITAVRKDGTRVEVELISVAVRDEHDDIAGYLGIHRDISERKALAETVAEVREAERHRIARALHDEALQELTHALALAQIPPDAPDGPATDELVPVLKRLGQQVRSAIYDLRLEDQEGLPFPERLEALVALHDTMAAGFRVELDISDGVPSIPLGWRGTEVLRLVGEALTNARRHSGAASIRVSASRSGPQLCVEVSDDGRGFQLGGETAVGGSGIIGMRERVVLLEGDLDIRSRPGQGTSVRVQLSLGQGEEPKRKARVLLVEDHAAVRQAIAAMFEREADFDLVAQAGTLAEARGMLDEIDVAVVDLGLPDGYGGDLIKELATVNPRAQALVLTASLDRAETARAVQSGASGTLDKVVQLDDVVHAVRRLRAGETLIPLDEVGELLRFADRQREQEHLDRAAIETLTRREIEVLQALANGRDSQAVADLLHITVRTERNHVASILTKLGVHSRLQALLFALRYGVVEFR
jgi:PAS domain S-box-containing protein